MEDEGESEEVIQKEISPEPAPEVIPMAAN